MKEQVTMIELPNPNEQLDEAIYYLSKDSQRFNDIAGTSSVFHHTTIKQQLQIILSEVDELVKAFNEETPVDVAAEAVDVIVTTIGLLQKLNNSGMDVPLICEMIARKNLEKFPNSSEVTLVDDTIKTYETKGVKITPTIVGDKFVLKDEQGKVRKPNGFVPIDLSEVNKGLLDDCFPVLQ